MDIKKIVPILFILSFTISVLNADNRSPLHNTYVTQSLMLIPTVKENRSDPFEREFVLPQKSRANLIVTNTLLIASAVAVINPYTRKKFKDRWELITSPNHASPLNQGPFRFTTLEEELNQKTQSDRGVHFLYHYLPVKPISFLCEYLIDGLPFLPEEKRRQEDWVSDEAFYFATALVFAGGLFEEYVDGKEIDEGFSRLDFVANGCGSLYAIMKHKGYFKNVYIYWSYRAPPEDWKWPTWDYMPGFEFRVVVDLSSFIFNKKREVPTLFTWWTDNIAYVGDVKEFGTTKPHNKVGSDPF
jgi:hypothetical protein